MLASSSFQKAEVKRQQDEQNILEKQQSIDFMKKKLRTLEEINKLRLQELLQFIERKKTIADRIERLAGRKAALESQIRICQCELLKLQLANTKEEATKEALNSCQRKCDDLENQQEEIDSSVSESREELQEMNQKLAETKESLAVVNQRVHFTKSNINEEESSLRLFQESFSAAMLKIRNVEEVLLSALDDYVRGSSEDVVHPATVTSTPGKLINSYSINFQCQYCKFLTGEQQRGELDKDELRHHLDDAEQLVADEVTNEMPRIKSKFTFIFSIGKMKTNCYLIVS